MKKQLDAPVWRVCMKKAEGCVIDLLRLYVQETTLRTTCNSYVLKAEREREKRKLTSAHISKLIAIER